MTTLHADAPDVVYHYCSVETFSKIMANKCFRLSDIEKSNDRLEKKYFLQTVQKALEEALAEYLSLEALENEVYEAPSLHPVKSAIAAYLQNPHTLDSFSYALCCSYQGDNIGQWRGYAENGKGVSIGIRTGCLPKAPNDMLLECKKIQYGEDAIRAYIRDFLEGPLEERTISITSQEDLLEEAAFAVLANFIAQEWIFFKHPAFTEEQEFRIGSGYGTFRDLSAPKIVNRATTDGRFRLSPVQYDRGSPRLKSFQELTFRGQALPEETVYPLQHGCENLFAAIILGPKCPLLEEDIPFFLAHCGFTKEQIKNLEIRRSAIPYV